MTPQPITNDPAELTMTSSMTETQRTHLNLEEQALLKELLRPGATVEAVIPPEATGEELWRTLDACVRGLQMLEARTLRLRPIIGRILLIFENKPSLYRDLGYETYSDFMKKGVYDALGLHRTTAYDARMAAEKWSKVGPDQYARIGPKNLGIISKFTTQTDPSAPLWLERAEKMKTNELREYCAQRGFIQPGETVGAVITITTNRAVYSLVNEFFSHPKVQEKVGSKQWDRILEALVQENFVEWTTEGGN